MKKTIFVLMAIAAVFSFLKGNARAAGIVVQQTDGSISASVGTGCSNACSNVPVGSQVFVPAISARVGAIEIFTSNFGTASRYPETNSCYLKLYDVDADRFVASSDNSFAGFGCAGDLTFTFGGSQPLLERGTHYRWEYVFGGQNFSGITFAGSPDDTVGGTFSVPPVVNAKFTVYAVVSAPISLVQSDAVDAIAEGGITNASSVILSAILPSASPDSLQLQVELEPSFVEFKGRPNLEAPFADSGSVAAVSTSSILAGAYHWQARAVDENGNASVWASSSDPPMDHDFIVYDRFSDVVVGDDMTNYSIGLGPAPCPGDGTIFSCSLLPAFNHYIVGSSSLITKVTFDWQNAGYNNCDGLGHYGAIITAAAATSSIIATSTNVIYMGCAGSAAVRTGEFDFSGESIPASFYLTFGAFDGTLQAGSGISITHVAVHVAVPKEPVVIVPGIFGSAYKDGRWILQPAFRPYDALKGTLVMNGYVEGQTLFDFPYDWQHRSIPSIAHEFADRITEIKEICGCGKVSVIAHSMGGLVVRQYIENGGYRGDIDQLVMLGVPNLGSPLAYLAWEGGTTLFSGPLDLVAILQKALIREQAIEAGFAPTPSDPDLQIYRYIHSSSSPAYAFQELLPTYDYLKDSGGGTLRTYPNGYPRNEFLESLNASTALMTFQKSGARVIDMYSGDQENTVTTLTVHDDASHVPLWNDGMPIALGRGLGDGAVPQNSAQAVSSGDALEVGGSHFDLPTNAEGRIVQLLTGMPEPIVAPPPSPIERYLSIFPLSPIDILVTAPDGSKIGEDPASGQSINQIGGAFYGGAGPSDRFVFIPDPEDGSYVVSALGLATGTYHIFVSYGYKATSTATSSEATFSANTQPGLIENLMVTVGSSTPDKVALVPEDDAPPSISHSALDPQYLLHASFVQFVYDAVDSGVGLYRVTSSLDAVPVLSGDHIDFDIPGSHMVAIRAQDFVGNISYATTTYVVDYDFGGFLPPLGRTMGHEYRMGRALPVKFQLKDADGSPVSTAVARLEVRRVQNGVVDPKPISLFAPAEGSAGIFRYDASKDQYTYELDTGQLGIGAWQIDVELDDGNDYAIVISLR